MSEFHLARMFRISFGKLPLQQIAAACGYADLSHFSHRFSKAVGAPPGRYRQALGASASSFP